MVVIAGDQPLYGEVPNPGPSALFTRPAADQLAPGAEEMFLGLDTTDRPIFARMAPPLGDDGPPEGTSQGDLRRIALAGALPEAEVSLLALARSMLSWHQSHLFCSKCGEPSQMVMGGFRRDCGSCGAQHFPRTDPVVITLVIDGEDALIARSECRAGHVFSPCRLC